ncbi:hypothetical protein PC9H_004055 [Pleurotus ostreatus]|uniref:ATP11-domain-containing protein n=1 Tax=Pleurotus ostreatus TaxID=5322 RepID=A0A8H7A2L1_PLEOS|nr:uncharacterized protein PC9H_004055 [Pleurotus ostreatus]KAF7437219.1 hypothetical protein PC9H_004055 [Pleurotus ostreatus]KAJ8703103.1 hypothetical protein PTI98_001754 [Pleurotus ostreatus]
MFRSLRLCSRPLTHYSRRRIHVDTTAFESKYAEKLRQRASERGLSVSELKLKAKEKQEAERLQLRKKLEEERAAQKSAQGSGSTASASSSKTLGATKPGSSERKDKSPIKPLNSFLNLEKLLSSPHKPEQIASLWTAYHASRSGGTGRGYVCASVPLDLYQKMADVGSRYPSFVVPIRRPSTGTTTEPGAEDQSAYEFYYLQWAFHDAPPHPAVAIDPFAGKLSDATPPANPPISTVLFTPLQEYKLRQSFATPYLIATNYTDLAGSHGTVLLRGEVTPAGSGSGNFMISQEDAHLLLMALQRFYLWGGASGSRESEPQRLLKLFHENPEQFKWEDLLKTVDWMPGSH